MSQDTNSDLSFDSLDVISNDAYRNGPPHELLTRLRNEAPIAVSYTHLRAHET
jgi:hypothetical protein